MAYSGLRLVFLIELTRLARWSRALVGDILVFLLLNVIVAVDGCCEIRDHGRFYQVALSLLSLELPWQCYEGVL